MHERWQEAVFRFYGELNDFLPLPRRQVSFGVRFLDEASVKDRIEGLGVPHPEVGLVVIDGEPADLGTRIRHGNRVAVYPCATRVDFPSDRFVADVHLGRLAALLRLLGFDTVWRNDLDDPELASIASQEDRVLLTRDRALLKRKEVSLGYCVRADHPEDQVEEVARRYGLWPRAAAFTRCARCNTLLVDAQAEEIEANVPPRVRARCHGYRKCPACGRLYWHGTHVDRLLALFERVRAKSTRHRLDQDGHTVLLECGGSPPL
jgi:uncharacterized protein with PIN domain